MAKILVVDDEKLIVKGLRFSLLQEGWEVDSAFDGEEGIQAVVIHPRTRIEREIRKDSHTRIDAGYDFFTVNHVPNGFPNLRSQFPCRVICEKTLQLVGPV